MSNRRFTQFFNTLHKAPVFLDCNFVVDDTNADGVSDLKGPGIEAVYMHTGITPSAENPNPAAGYAVIKLQDNYNYFYSAYCSVKSPNSGASLLVASAGLTIGMVYVITILGNTSLAQWQALGVPVGITPAVGVPFVALATSATGTGAVQIPRAGASNIASMETVGDSNLVIKSTLPNILGQQSGSYIIARFLGVSSSSAALTFTGAALGTHTHIFTGDALAGHDHTIPVTAGTAGDAVTNNAGVLESVGGEDLTSSSVSGGTPAGTNDAVSAGTPAGTINTPAITSSLITTAPANGSLVSLGIYLSNSRITVQGE